MSRFLSVLAVLFVLATTTAARAEDAPCPPHKTTGIVLTTVGSSLIVTAPLVVVVAAATVDVYSFTQVMGPVVLGAMGGAALGIGLLIPGIVMLAKRTPMPQTRQPAWAENRPAQTGMRAVTIPILRGSF